MFTTPKHILSKCVCQILRVPGAQEGSCFQREELNPLPFLGTEEEEISQALDENPLN